MSNNRCKRLYVSLCFIFISIMTVWAQEFLLQEEQDFRFALQLAEKGMFDLAAVQFVNFTDHYPTSPHSPEALFRAAESYEAIKNHANSLSIYMRLLLSYPQSTLCDKALFNRAKILTGSGDHLNAALTFERIRLFAPESELIPLGMLSAGREYFIIGDHKRAREAAYYILEKYPSHLLRFEARYFIAAICRQEQKTTAAMIELDKIMGEQLDPELIIKAKLLRGQLLQTMGKYAKADSLLESLLTNETVNDSVGVAAVQLVRSLTSRGFYQRASKVAEKALSLNLDKNYKNQLYIEQSDIFFVTKEYQWALRALEVVDGEELTAWQSMALYFRRAVILKKLAQSASALALYQAICESPDTSHAAILLKKRALVEACEVLCAQQRPGEALRLLRHQYETSPEWRDLILLQKGKIQQEVMQDWPGARLTYNMLIEFYPDSPLADDAALGIARCFDQEGQTSQALMAYEQYIKLFTAADEYLYARERMDYLRKFAPVSESNIPPGLQEIIRQILTAEGKTENMLTLAKEQIQISHNYRQGMRYLQLALADSGVSVDPVELLYWLGICHARLAQKAQIDGQMEQQAAQIDSLTQIAGLMFERAADDTRTQKILYESITAVLPQMKSTYDRALYLNRILEQTVLPDSLRLSLQYRQAESWYLVGTDSTSVPLLRRAAGICSLMMQEPIDEELAGETLFLQYKIYTVLQQPDSAAQNLRTCIDRFTNAPRVVEAMWTLADIYEKKLQYRQAGDIYLHLARRFYYTSHGLKAGQKYCQTLFKQGLFDEAQDCVNQYRHLPELQELLFYLQDEVDDEILWLAALIQLRQDNTQLSIKAVREYLDLSIKGTHRAEALLTVAELYTKIFNVDAALGHYEELIAAFPRDTLAQIAQIRSADLLFDRGGYKEAQKKYQLIKSIGSGDTQRLANVREVVCEYRLGNIPRARTLVDAFKKQYKDRPSEATFINEDAQFCLDNKDFKYAEDQFKELASKYRDLPDGANGELGLARLYVILNRTDEALKILTNIPNKYSDPRVLATAYVNLGEFYYVNRQLENCITAGRKAVEYQIINRENQRALTLLIRVYDDLRLWDNAITLLREYVKNYPDADDHYARRVQIGIFLISLKEYDRGIAYLRDLLPEADAESEAEIQYWIAHAYNERGNIADAIIEYLKVKYVCKPTKLPWGTTALYEAGQAYVKLGNLQQARALFQEIVREMGAGDQFGRVANERIKEIDAQLANQTKNKNG